MKVLVAMDICSLFLMSSQEKRVYKQFLLDYSFGTSLTKKDYTGQGEVL